MAMGIWDRAQYLRELISEAAGESVHTVEEGLARQGALLFLNRKLDEVAREVMTGD